MTNRIPTLVGTLLVLIPVSLPAQVTAHRIVDITFRSQDEQKMFGRLSLPDCAGRRPVVMMIQTAEAQTIDSRVQGPRGPIEFHDLYRKELAAIGVAFFSYEGRGVRMGDQPPRYVTIDRAVYNTSTLERKVQDAIAAVRTLRLRPDIDPSKIFLTGVSEGTLLASETAARMPGEIKGLVLSSVMTDLREAIMFMLTDGAFLQHQGHWDADRDGTITAAEFQADPRRIRRLIPTVEFKNFDMNDDGVYTIEDRMLAAKPLVEAVREGHADAVAEWLKNTASVETPDGWLEDHFAHASTWAFLSQLDIPVGIFHGESDGNTPVKGVRDLERRANAAGKTKFEFHYFPGLDHSLGGLDYFVRGIPSEGYKELFAFVKREAAR